MRALTKIAVAVLLLGVLFSVLGVIAIVTKRPLQGTIIPPYGLIQLPETKVWHWLGWEVDAAVGSILGTTGVISGLLLLLGSGDISSFTEVARIRRRV